MNLYIYDHAGRPYEVKAETEEAARRELAEHILKRDGMLAAAFPIFLTATYEA